MFHRVDEDGIYHSPNVCFIDPVSLAVISTVATVAGTGIGIMGSMQQASATADAARYQSQVAKNNQQIAQDNAAYARQAGQEQAARESQKTAAIIGGEEAGYGASGIDLASGSPANVVKATRQVGRLDQMNLLQQSDLTARGYNITASNQAAEAGLQSMKASNAETAGLYSAGSSLVGGVSSLSDKWLKYSAPGGPFS